MTVTSSLMYPANEIVTLDDSHDEFPAHGHACLTSS